MPGALPQDPGAAIRWEWRGAALPSFVVPGLIADPPRPLARTSELTPCRPPDVGLRFVAHTTSWRRCATDEPGPFDLTLASQRVVFGVGVLDRVPELVTDLGCSRPLLVASASATSWAGPLAARLHPVARTADVVQHVPQELAEAATALATTTGADVLVTVGGGSATGLGKAVAVATGLPLVAVPTTYAGSELTAVHGTTGRHKATGRDDRALPRVVVLDPRLTVSMPSATTATSGLNALAHCVEAVYAPGRSPLTTPVAEAGARSLARALPRAVAAPTDLDARSEALRGAMLAGWVMNLAGTSVHHKLCHVLGGTYRLPHAAVHAVLLPHTVALVEAGIPEQLRGIADALGAGTATAGVAHLARAVRAPTSLAALGLPESALDEAAGRAATELAGAGPVPVGEAVLRRLLDDAYAGRTPGLLAPSGRARPGEPDPHDPWPHDP